MTNRLPDWQHEKKKWISKQPLQNQITSLIFMKPHWRKQCARIRCKHTVWLDLGDFSWLFGELGNEKLQRNLVTSIGKTDLSSKKIFTSNGSPPPIGGRALSNRTANRTANPMPHQHTGQTQARLGSDSDQRANSEFRGICKSCS